MKPRRTVTAIGEPPPRPPFIVERTLVPSRPWGVYRTIGKHAVAFVLAFPTKEEAEMAARARTVYPDCFGS